MIDSMLFLCSYDDMYCLAAHSRLTLLSANSAFSRIEIMYEHDVASVSFVLIG